MEGRNRRTGLWPFSPGWLVVLGAPLEVQSAQETINRARAQAARPALLRFVLPAALEGQLEAGDSALAWYEGDEPLVGALSHLADEKNFLLLLGEHDFAPRWDASLLAALRPLGDQPTLLTGSITPGKYAQPPMAEDAPTLRAPKMQPGKLASIRQAMPEIQRVRARLNAELPKDHPPEVCLPALKERLSDTETVIGKGLPLVLSAGTVPTLVIDPAFVAGSVQFLRDSSLELNTLSLAAFLTGWRVHVLDEALLWPVKELPRRLMVRPPQAALPGTTASRFEQLLGFGQEVQSAKAVLGLFGPPDSYPQRMNAPLLLSQKAYATRLRMLEARHPLIVSAFIDLPDHLHPLPFYGLRFGFLRRLKSLPLLLFTGGSQERALRSAFPHTQSYPDNDVLPNDLLSQGMTPKQHHKRSKMALLSRAVRKQVEFSHAAWLDMDILPHPICPEALLNFEAFLDDRIHIATVHGIPDASFVVMPSAMVHAVAQEVKSITLLDAELKRGFSEELLWERLFIKHPDWFVLHPMPRRRLLFLTVFDPRFLSQSIRPLLADLPEPVLGTLEKRPSKEASLS